MAISSGLGVSAIKPGVVDSAATRPASPYEGQVIFQKDTDQLLVWNGTAWVIPNQTTQNPEGLELIKTQSFTTADPLDITSVFTDDYNTYKIIINYFGSASTNLLMQFFSGTNTLFSGNDYYRYGIRVDGGNGISGLAAQNTSAQLAAHDSNSSQRTLCEITIGNTRNTARKYIYSNLFNPSDGSLQIMNFQVISTLLFTGVRFDASSGSITGDVQVYGYRK